MKRRTALVALASLVSAPRTRAQGTRATSVSVAEITTADGVVTASYLKPEGLGPFPVVLVAAEEPQGVAADACQRLSEAGCLAVAPDLFTANLPDAGLMQRLDMTRDWAGRNGGDVARLAIVGFGPGGRVAWLYDAHRPELKAAIAWNGPTSALEAAPRLHAPLLGLYGTSDHAERRALLDAEAKAKQAGTTAEIVVYVGAASNFASPGTVAFDQAAALDGWKRTFAWLQRYGVV